MGWRREWKVENVGIWVKQTGPFVSVFVQDSEVTGHFNGTHQMTFAATSKGNKGAFSCVQDGVQLSYEFTVTGGSEEENKTNASRIVHDINGALSLAKMAAWEYEQSQSKA